MKTFASLELDWKACKEELADFKALLDSKPELDEQKDILPNFKKWTQLSAFIAHAFLNVLGPPLLYAHEHSLSGDLTVDLVVGDRSKKKYCFIEFEDAKEQSLFRRTGSGRATPVWGDRFLKGQSQLVDWFWKHQRNEYTPDYKDQFGEPPITFLCLLVIGRSAFLDSPQRERIEWFQKHVVVNSQHLQILTFDDLFDFLKEKLDHIDSLSRLTLD